MALFRRRNDKGAGDLPARSEQLGLRKDDLLVMGQLIEHGADLTQPRHTRHYLYFGDGAAAGRAGDQARDEGFEVAVREPGGGIRDWAVICEKDGVVLDPDTVRANSDLFESLAATHDGEYDGWEAAVS